jgi:hypothetical protein
MRGIMENLHVTLFYGGDSLCHHRQLVLYVHLAY